MSRDILIGCPGTFLFFECESFGHAAFFVAWLGSWFEAAGLAVFVGVDGEFAEDFSGFSVDDGDVEVVDEHAYWCAAECGAELDVVGASGASEHDGACLVDGVLSDAVVAVAVVFGGGFGSGGVEGVGGLSL